MNSPAEKDRFSAVAANYASFRPTYPQSLYDSILAHVPARDVALDCGTGNGQAAAALAPHFTNVYATDISAAQMAVATQRPNIHYRLMPGHQAPDELRPESTDLIVSAQAMHWFERDKFFDMVTRTLKPGGVLAVWAYGNHKTDDPAINAVVDHINSAVLGDYWDPEVQSLMKTYDDMTLPLTPLQLPPLVMQSDWDLAQLLGYFKSWSAAKKFMDQKGEAAFDEELKPVVLAWGSPSLQRTFTVTTRLKAAKK